MNGVRRQICRRQLIAAIVLTLLGVAASSDAWADILHIAWRDQEASHIFLVPLVVFYLIWVRQRRFRHVHIGATWVGPLIVGMGWGFYTVGDIGVWQSVWHGGAIMIAVGCFLTIMGTAVLRAFLPAFMVLVFLIPVPGRLRYRIALPMQNATARVTESIFETLEVPVVRTGNLLKINGVDVAIAEACNGLRMVFALVLVCYAFAFGNPLRGYARFLILLASPLAAIVCNVIRLIPTVYVYGNYSSELADGFHSASAWVMLFVAFLLLLGILRMMRWAILPVYRFTLAYD